MHPTKYRAVYVRGDYAEAWKELHLCEGYGGGPLPDQAKALSAKMPEPKR